MKTGLQTKFDLESSLKPASELRTFVGEVNTSAIADLPEYAGLFVETDQQAFLRLANQREQVIDTLKNLNKELEKVMLKLGYETFLQDPTNLVVYKIVEPTGAFVTYKSVDYVRTRKDGENSGDLSESAAEEAGFVTGAALRKKLEKSAKKKDR